MQVENIFRRRKRLAAVVLSVWLLSMLAPVSSPRALASDWMFRRSYFSHKISRADAKRFPRPRSRSAYRRAVTNFQPGFAIRGGYRINRIFMRSGNSTDLTILREDWYDLRP